MSVTNTRRGLLKDALHHERERVRIEAQRWLWWVAPNIAQRAGVPWP